MAAAARGAARMGICGEECRSAIIEMIERHGLPVATDYAPDRLLEAAFRDKKRSGRNISLILPEKIGKCVIRSFGLDELAEFIRAGVLS
jgi:3-dehydroquinate synthase